MTDAELLRAYVEQGDEGAFAGLVRGHVDVVYGAALRRTGDPGMAEDVTQAVFIVLAKRARGIRDGRVLAGWLMGVTRHCAADARKLAMRRRVHEGAAAALKEMAVKEDAGMKMDVAGILDEGLEGLGEMDRTAVVLRCLEERSLAEVGRMMGMSEGAAKKRVERAVEKMRKIFAGKGMVLSAGVIVGVMAKQLNAAPLPVGLAEKVLAGALGKGVATSTAAVIAKGVVKVMGWTVAKILGVAAVGIVVVGLGATGVVVMTNAGKNEVATSQDVEGASARTVGARMGALEGLPIMRVEVVGTDKEAILNMVQVQVGEKYSRVKLDQDVRTVQGLDRYSAVRAEVIPEADKVKRTIAGVTVQFVVVERAAVGTGRERYAYLDGEAKHSGVYEVGQHQLTLKMLVTAGGEPADGWSGKVVLLMRRVDEGHENLSVVDAMALVAGERMDPYVEENDVVTVVPREMAAGMAEVQGRREWVVGRRVAVAPLVGPNSLTLQVIMQGQGGTSDPAVRLSGEVRVPGAYILSGKVTAREMLAESSGVKDVMKLDLPIRLIRHLESGDQTLDMTWGELVSGARGDMYVQSGDEMVVGGNGNGGQEKTMFRGP